MKIGCRFCDEMPTCEAKKDFSENNGQAMEDPEFKFQPVPAELAEGCLNGREYLRGSEKHDFWRLSVK